MTTMFCLVNVDFLTYYSVSVLRSASSTSLDVRRFLLQLLVCGTVFHHTSLLPPVSPSSAVVLNHISSHFLVPLSDSSVICTVPLQWLVILDTVIIITLYIYFSTYKGQIFHLRVDFADYCCCCHTYTCMERRFKKLELLALTVMWHGLHMIVIPAEVQCIMYK